MYLLPGAARISVLIVALTIGTAAAAQTAILYEENPSDGIGKRYDGAVSWHLQDGLADSAEPMETAIRGQIVIPERQMKVTLTIRRDNNKRSPVSHLISTQFTLPADFEHGGIQELRAILMKDSETTRGVQLTGSSVNVTPGFFLVGLSLQAAVRNVELLEQRGWFDIAFVYDDQRRAILAVEKGAQGERVFKDALEAWARDSVPAAGPGK